MSLRKVASIVFYQGNKILLQYRGGIAKYGEEWGFFGGGIEEGETPEQAVVRETKEELDHDLTDHTFVGEFFGHYSHKYIFISPLEGKQFRQLEGTAMKQFTFDECMQLGISNGDKKVVMKLKELLKGTD